MKWIIFIYKVPPQPTKYRAYLWRELKKFGSIYLQDGVCLLPDSDDVHLFIGALAEKVREFGGQESTFLSNTFSTEKDQEMIEQFNSARTEEYNELIPGIKRLQGYFEEEEAWEFDDEQLQRVREEFQKTIRQFQIIEARDYFEAEAGRKVRLLLDQCRKQLLRF
ncbi:MULTISPECIES: Chromate resistance protein ChrB [unclassified Paenibacillus]|uniref:Chromate resistance protein ChrB n=1 Tax=unclassified Paenibacillus TaxID=185978 RepID=UPI0036259C37